ncbi:MAG TPA: hypothetical protein VE754_04985 [Actinomycetota bacterium]|nr:hypothetical protein [Actinomycetota bacterium]
MRLIRLALVVAALAVLPTGPARADLEVSTALEGTTTGCGVFPWVQTYRTWGPAAAYGHTVTVVYAARRCAEDAGSLQALGIATVHRGRTAAGEVLDVLPFHNIVSWTGNRFSWWSCTPSASYEWMIDGLYSFAASATDGKWVLDVDPGPSGPFHWEYKAC